MITAAVCQLLYKIQPTIGSPIPVRLEVIQGFTPCFAFLVSDAGMWYPSYCTEISSQKHLGSAASGKGACFGAEHCEIRE